MRDVAGELSGPVDRDGFRRLPGFVDDLDLARLDDEELEVAVADLEELLAVRKRLSAAWVQRASVAIWSSSSVGNATACKLVSAMAQSPYR